MSEQLLSEHATISVENKSSAVSVTPGSSGKRKRKRNRNRSAQKNNVELHEIGKETSINNNCQEQSTELVNAVDVISKICSQIKQSEAVSPPKPGKKKRAKKKKKGEGSMNVNGTGPENVKATSSNGSPLEGDVLYHLSACINMDGKLLKQGAEPSLSGDTSMAQPESQQHDTKESSSAAVNNDYCHDVQMGGALPVLDVKAINPTCTLETSSLPEVPEQSDAVVTPTTRNKKRARKKKGKNPLKDNGTGSDKLEATSSKGPRLEGDAFAHPSACIKVDDKIKHGAELCLSEDTSMPKQENQRHGITESSADVPVNSVDCHSLQMGGAVPVLDVEAINSTCKLESSSLLEVPEQSDVVVTPMPRNKKRARKKKGKNPLNDNSTGSDKLEGTSSNGPPLEGDVFAQPSACIKVDNKIKHGAELCLSEDPSMPQQENQRHDIEESSGDVASNSGDCHGLQMGGAVPVLDVKAINSTCKQESSSLPEVPGQSDAVVTPTLRNKKRARKKKGKNSLNDNGTGLDKLEATSSNGSPLNGHVFAHHLACIKVDDKIKHGAELCLSEDTSMPQQENQRHDIKESRADVASNSGDCHGLQMGGAVPVLDVKAINSTCKQESSSLPEVPAQRSFPPDSVNVSPMTEFSNHADANTAMGKNQNEEENVKTYSRKRRKISGSSGKSSETIAEGASSVVLIFPDESGNNCLNCSGEALATVCSGVTLEQEALAGNDKSMAAGNDVCSDLKHPSMAITENLIELANGECSVKDVTMADLAGENSELAEMAKLNSTSTVNAVCDMHSAEEKMDAEVKASVVGSAHGPLQIFELKIQTKTEESISSSSELGSLQVNATQLINQPSLGTAINVSSKKKLLVLDVNGLLADIVPFDNVQYEPDTVISTKAVFKRPFCDDFLKFCFERFNVGVWSSRTKRNVQRFLDFLLRKKGYNLVFCWDQSHCTETGFKTIENREKPLLLKELKKLWEKQDPDLPWERGEYDESNTLLLDDSPYKALRNPPNTAIFPYTFEYWHKTDNALAAKGHLRMYLERLAAAENVQKFVERNPFGQRPITNTSTSWPFYLKVIGSTASQPEAGGNSSSATKSPVEEQTNASLAC